MYLGICIRDLGMCEYNYGLFTHVMVACKNEVTLCIHNNLCLCTHDSGMCARSLGLCRDDFGLCIHDLDLCTQNQSCAVEKVKTFLCSSDLKLDFQRLTLVKVGRVKVTPPPPTLPHPPHPSPPLSCS